MISCSPGENQSGAITQNARFEYMMSFNRKTSLQCCQFCFCVCKACSEVDSLRGIALGSLQRLSLFGVFEGRLSTGEPRSPELGQGSSSILLDLAWKEVQKPKRRSSCVRCRFESDLAELMRFLGCISKTPEAVDCTAKREPTKGEAVRVEFIDNLSLLATLSGKSLSPKFFET